MIDANRVYQCGMGHLARTKLQRHLNPPEPAKRLGTSIHEATESLTKKRV